MRLLLTAAVLTAQLPHLSDEQLAEAIRLGQQKKAPAHECTATAPVSQFMNSDNGSFDIFVMGPIGRVAFAAQQAKAKYLSFTLENVTDQMRTLDMAVVATPQPPEIVGGTWHRTAAATHVVLKHKKHQDIVMQPSSLELTRHEWGNAVGGKFDGQGATAVFNAAAFHALPPGDVDVVVVTDGGERRCKIGSKDRLKLR
jgi:hypothetical protein